MGHSLCISHGEKLWSLALHQNLPHTSIAVFLLINFVFLYHIKVRRAAHQSFSIFIFCNTPTTTQHPTRTASIQRLKIYDTPPLSSNHNSGKIKKSRTHQAKTPSFQQSERERAREGWGESKKERAKPKLGALLIFFID